MKKWLILLCLMPMLAHADLFSPKETYEINGMVFDEESKEAAFVNHLGKADKITKIYHWDGGEVGLAVCDFTRHQYPQVVLDVWKGERPSVSALSFKDTSNKLYFNKVAIDKDSSEDDIAQLGAVRVSDDADDETIRFHLRYGLPQSETSGLPESQWVFEFKNSVLIRAYRYGLCLRDLKSYNATTQNKSN